MAGPKFTQTIHTGSGVTAGANTARDGTGSNILTLITGVANGTDVYRVRITAGGTTTDGMIRLFVNDGAYRLISEIPVPGRTPSSTLPVWSTVWTPPGGLVPLSGTAVSLRATTHNNETFYLVAEGRDY